MNSLFLFSKFIDQPLLVAKFSKAMPAILGASSAVFGAVNTYLAPEKEKKETLVKNTFVLGVTSAAAYYASKKLNGIKPLREVILKNTALVETFLEKNTICLKNSTILNKSKNKVLNFSEIKTLYQGLTNYSGKKLLSNLISPPKKLNSKEIFKEIGRLSVMGVIPVLGGVAGGIASDMFNGKQTKKELPDKINEGIYQYFANIFLCNVGAGAGLMLAEKLAPKSKLSRITGMFSGIVLVGVVGGSFLANLAGNKLVNPIFKNKCPKIARTPELLDLSLHVDDIATVGVLSGFKWVEPALPLLYSVSGYRAGTGYRNHKKCPSQNIPQGYGNFQRGQKFFRGNVRHSEHYHRCQSYSRLFNKEPFGSIAGGGI